MANTSRPDQMAIMCISCVYMCLLCVTNKSKVCIVSDTLYMYGHVHTWYTPDNSLDVFVIPKNPYFNPSLASDCIQAGPNTFGPRVPQF